MIRRATKADIPALTFMGRKFFEESGFGAEMVFDEESLRKTLEHLLDSDDGVVFIAIGANGRPIGGAGAMAYPYYFNLACRAGQELFWWIDPEIRGGLVGIRLLHALEAWAKERGCRTFTMISLPAIGDSPAARIYPRMGYRPSEHSFIKRVN